MADTYELPDPLPDMLPDESRTAYRNRVVPGYMERGRLKSSRNRFVRSRCQAVRRNHNGGSVPGYIIEQTAEEAREDWTRRNPENAERLAFLNDVVPRVYFDDPTP